MFTKYFFRFLLAALIISNCSFAQGLTTDASGFNIQAGTTVFIDSLVLMPTSNLAITSNTFSSSTSPLSIYGGSSITKVFNFSSPLAFTGTMAVYYTTGDLNGNAAQDLVVAYNSASAGVYTLICSSTSDTVNRKVTTSSLSAAPLYNIAALQSGVSLPAISGASNLVAGDSTTLSDATGSGTWSSTNTSLATVNTAGLVAGISGGTDTIVYTVSNTCNTASQIKVITVNDNAIWTGTTSNDWSTASNWSIGVIPNANVSATIPSGTTNSPEVISSSYITKKLSIDSGAVVTLNTGSQLNVKNTLANNGIITGNGALYLNSTTVQTISGTGSVNNLLIDNPAGATIDSGAIVNVKSTLTINNGTLNTNDSLVLYSDSSATARIAAITAAGAAISGNVKVMQYIPGGYRRWRFWSHPFSSYIPLSQLEQSIDVTGTGGSANGFTTTGSNSPSAFMYHPAIGNSAMAYDPGWQAFTGTSSVIDSNRIHQYQGIRLFVRGAKGEGLGYGSYVPSAANISQTGPVNQGTQTMYMTKGTGANQDYNLFGNPYPSPVDIGTVLYNAKVSGNITGAAFYVWNPYLSAAGQFQAIPVSTVSAVPYYLQTDAAFEVRAAANNDSLVFSENNKSVNVTATLLRSVPEYVSLEIYDAGYHPWDMLYFNFADYATDNEDNDFDALKLSGPDFNFYSLSADNKKLAIDGRPYATDKIIPLGISSNYSQEFIIKAESIAVPGNGKVYLHDKLLQQYVLLQQGSEYKFNITGDSATQGDKRFELTMKPAAETLAGTPLEVSMMPNPATDEVKISFNSGTNENVSLRVLDLSGVCVFNDNLGQVKNGSVAIPLENLAAGIYMVELTSGNQKVIKKLMKD